MASADTGQKCFTYCFVSFQYEIRQECMKIKYISRVKKSNASTLSKHTYTQRDPPRNSTLLTNKHSQPSITLCQPKPVLFPGSTGLQCPHCECATATACCWITVKYYPDDIDIVGYASLFLFQVRLPPSQFGEQSFPADCWSPTDLRTPQDSCPIAW